MLGELQVNRELSREIGKAVATLNEKERFIIEKRVTSDEPLTLQDIADHFSISRERVRQIEEAALRKIKNTLTPILAEAQGV
jgi:RNA polymerase sigma-32 factor